MTHTKLLLSVAAASVLALNGCGGGSSSTDTTTTITDTTTPDTTTFERPADCTTYATPTNPTLPSTITECTYLTADTTWIIDGLVTVSGTTLKIEPGTTLAGLNGTASNTSYMVVDRDAKIIANGTEADPIIFTSADVAVDHKAPAVGQWGGLTIIGNAANAQVAPYEVNTDFVPGMTDLADNSGILTYVQVLNSGITMDVDKEINGLSLVGVGSGTTIENITVEKSDDDCVEIWGGTVNLTNVKLRECTDDQFDVDDGYAGTVKNLDIHQTATNSGNAGIEMSGTTAATFDGFTIIQDASSKEGGIYFKNGAGIAGHFLNGTVTDNVVDDFGAIHSNDADVDTSKISFENVTVDGTDSDDRFTGDAGDAIEAIYDMQI
jgi:hypothetical protein